MYSKIWRRKKQNFWWQWSNLYQELYSIFFLMTFLPRFSSLWISLSSHRISSKRCAIVVDWLDQCYPIQQKLITTESNLYFLICGNKGLVKEAGIFSHKILNFHVNGFGWVLFIFLSIILKFLHLELHEDRSIIFLHLDWLPMVIHLPIFFILQIILNCQLIANYQFKRL